MRLSDQNNGVELLEPARASDPQCCCQSMQNAIWKSSSASIALIIEEDICDWWRHARWLTWWASAELYNSVTGINHELHTHIANRWYCLFLYYTINNIILVSTQPRFVLC